MTTPVVARKDFYDAVRSLSLRVATLLLVGAACAVYGFVWVAEDIDGPRLATGLEVSMLVVQFVVALIAILVGFGAIVGERNSGSIKVVLGLPPTRRELFLGKFLGRTLVVGTAVCVTFLALVALSLATYGRVPLDAFLPLLVLSLVLGAVWTAIAVSISAASGSRTRVIAGCLAVWLLFVALWEVLLSALNYAVEGTFPESTGQDLAAEPGWRMALQRLNPVEAFSVVASDVVGPTIAPALFQFGAGDQRGEYTTAERFHGEAGATEVPLYLESEVAVLVLLAWIVVPLAIGYWRFRSTDL